MTPPVLNVLSLSTCDIEVFHVTLHCIFVPMFKRRLQNKVNWRKIPHVNNLMWLRLYQGNTMPSDYHLFAALRQNLGSHRFKYDCEMAATVTLWQEHRTRPSVDSEQKRHPYDMTDSSGVTVELWRCIVRAVQLTLNGSCCTWKWRAHKYVRWKRINLMEHRVPSLLFYLRERTSRRWWPD